MSPLPGPGAGTVGGGCWRVKMTTEATGSFPICTISFQPDVPCVRVRVCVCVCVLVVQSCPTLCHPMDCSSPGSSVHGDSRGKTTGVGCHSLLQGIFPTQGSNPGLLHCRRILCRLSHQGSPECTPDLLCWLLCTPKEGFMGKQEGRQGQENKQNPEC